jgi:phosphoribosylamine--glycine ligase
MKNLAGVHVVSAAHGYPGAGGTPVRKGDPIEVPAELLPREGEPERVKLFFAGVARSGNHFVTNGGRVLGLTVLAPTRAEARERAYAISSTIRFDGVQRRADVGR